MVVILFKGGLKESTARVSARAAKALDLSAALSLALLARQRTGTW